MAERCAATGPEECRAQHPVFKPAIPVKERGVLRWARETLLMTMLAHPGFAEGTQQTNDGRIHGGRERAGSSAIREDALHPTTTTHPPESAEAIRVPEGFTIECVAPPEIAGSVINLTFDTEGRLLVARGDAGIFVLRDADQDGIYDDAEQLTGDIRNCEGLLAYDASTYFAMGQGPEGSGLYRLRKEEHGGAVKAEKILAYTSVGMGEHLGHAIVRGPDRALYIIGGDAAMFDAVPGADSPVRAQYEADLLSNHPKTDARNIIGGTIWRIPPEGESPKPTLEAAGLRNAYDFAFNARGDMFTVDSDMEWDMKLPWYREVRVLHCPPGAEFGWRERSHVWPDYFLDSVPGIQNIGLGSPTGMDICQHPLFPKDMQDALFVGDWVHGQVLLVRLIPNGTSYTATVEEFASGGMEAFAVTDVAFGADGLYVATGGREARGAVYRIQPKDRKKQNLSPPLTAEEQVQRALEQPQPQSAWGRAAIGNAQSVSGEAWGACLEQIVRNPEKDPDERLRALTCLEQVSPKPDFSFVRSLAEDDDPVMRGQAANMLARFGMEAETALRTLLGDGDLFVQRRALESIMRVGMSVPAAELRPPLASADRFLRYAAGLVLERQDPAGWQESLLHDENPRVAVMAIVILNKIGLVSANEDLAQKVCTRLEELFNRDLSPDDEPDIIRGLELSLGNVSTGSFVSSAHRIERRIIDRFPTGNRPIDRELSRALGMLKTEKSIETLLMALERRDPLQEEERSDAIHYAHCLAAIPAGWTREQKERVLSWYESTEEWKGGKNFALYMEDALRRTIDASCEMDRDQWLRLSREAKEKEVSPKVHERAQAALDAAAMEGPLHVLEQATRFPRAASMVILDRLSSPLQGAAGSRYVRALHTLLAQASPPPPIPHKTLIGALGATEHPDAEIVLLRLYEEGGKDRDDATIALAGSFRNVRHREIFLVALSSPSREVMNAAVQALSSLKGDPSSPSGPGGGVKLSETERIAAMNILLERMRERAAKTRPASSAPPPSKWNIDELAAYLDTSIRNGSVSRGHEIFERQCARCHKAGTAGNSVGPDLASVMRRLKGRELLEAMLDPSKVIPDQYRTIQIATKSGEVIIGLLEREDDQAYTLRLAENTLRRIPKKIVESMQKSDQSIMPTGLLDDLPKEHIADLWTFLESQSRRDTLPIDREERKK